MAERRRIAVVLVDLANYGRLRPVMALLRDDPRVDLRTVVSGSLLLEQWGLHVRTVRADGFRVDAEVYIEMSGSNPTTMAKSLGIAVMEFSTTLRNLAPDLVLVIGDRYEMLGAVLAAAYQNLPIAHIQGGEVSGSIDESARHAISKFAQFHFPSTKRAGEYLVRMGERPDTVFVTGCPSGDIIHGMDRRLPPGVFDQGVGARVDPARPFAFVMFHPVTTEFGNEERQAEVLLDAMDALDLPTVWRWPNIDAGSDHVSKILRRHRETRGDRWLRLVKGFPPHVFEAVLGSAALLVGNSSGFVRDASFLGTPTVLVGSRQDGRETAEHLVRVPVERDAILAACRRQLAHGPYAAADLYGDGKAAPRIVERLVSVTPYVQKTLAYARPEGGPR